MKGVLLGRLPGVQLVDLSHEVPAFDVLAGALLLEACVPRFPLHAVHCAVVDPGVGTSRRPVCLVDPAGRRLVGPDNGLFTAFLGAGARAYLLAEGPSLPAPASATFHGRDLFAPAAALLASGADPAALGPPVPDPVRLDWPAAERRADGVHGVVLAADSFGNLLTSLREADLPAGPLRAEVGGLPARVVRTYGEARRGELVALVGSSGRIEVAVREGSAAATLGGGRGTALVVRGPA
jgi:hypothetical protein